MKDWKEEFREKFIAFEDPDILDGFATDKLINWIESNFVSKEDLIKMVKSKKMNKGYSEAQAYDDALDDIIKELKG